jgi:Zn-dependent peptidase ImmA (M78 family)
MASTKAESIAARLLDEHGITAPPIDIEDIAAVEGALVVRNHFPGLESGFALREGTKWIIGVNTATSPRRQRFTIAHELGHLLLHQGKPLITDYSIYVNRRDETSSLGTEREEIEANAFAAAILMPREFVVAELQRELDLSEVASRDELIARLARTFRVSAEAMGYRLVNLNIITA